MSRKQVQNATGVEEKVQGRGRGPCLGPNVKFFWKRFLYVIILMQI